jgi:ubiquinone/menaquinone biosynthesis C-methylase UbiE
MKIVPQARGRVLEVGIGSGLNMAFYDRAKVTEVVGLDPSVELLSMAERSAGEAPFDVELVPSWAEAIPLDRASVDTALVTYTLCSISATEPALREVARVLRPGGQLLFCEHGKAPDATVRRWQNRLNPLWRRFSGGCELNRDIPALIQRGGFRITGMETMYIPGWRPASFNYWGAAVAH